MGTSLRQIQAGGGGAAGPLARVGLRVLAVGYGAATWLRALVYRVGWIRPRALGRPTISVGNLTAGGTGKTPTVAWLATELSALGRRPAVLSRGYGPRPPGADLSDEGLLLRRLLPPSVPYAEDPRRLRSAARLLAAHPEIDVFLLDDGFQHRRAARDLDIVLLDATEPFGFDHRLPRGLLREPPSALARADALVVTRAERASSGALAALRERLATYSDAPVAVARTAAVGLEVAGRTLSPEALRGRAVHACSGIGNPDAFAGLLGDLGARVVGRTDLPDHAMPSDAALAAVASRAAAEGAAWVVVTRKDAVKRARIPDGTAVLDVETRFLEGRDALLALVVAAIRPTG